MNILESTMILFVLMIWSLVANGQQTFTYLSTLNLVQPQSCNRQTQYYDIGKLQCLACPTNSVPYGLYNCRCTSNYYFVTNNGGGRITCAACPTGQIQSLDGFSCIPCDTACTNCGTTNSYLTDLDTVGDSLATRTCVTCDSASSILVNGNRCGSCQPFIFVDSDTTPSTLTACNDANLLNSGGLLILNNNQFSVASFYFNSLFGTDSVTSYLYSRYLIAVYRTCQRYSKRNVTSCQALGNFCVLNMYNTITSTSGLIDACTGFQNLQLTSTDTNQNPATSTVWGDLMPWLYYPVTLSVYKSTYETSGLNGNGQFLTLSYSSSKCYSQMSFYAAQYSLYGNLTSFEEIDVSRLQLCKLLDAGRVGADTTSPFSATNFYQSCTLSVAQLLTLGKNPVFFDLYIQYSNNGSNLLPIPIQVTNYRSTLSQATTQNNFNDDNMQRRFFLVEAVSSIQTLGGSPKYVRYAKEISLFFNLMDNQDSGQIYPPVVQITYDFISASDTSAEVEVNFKINYLMNLTTQTIVIWSVVGFLLIVALFFAIFRSWIWNRRAGRGTLDIGTLFKFLMYMICHLGNILLFVFCGVCFFWLIFYKGQAVVFLALPTFEQSISLLVLIVVAFFCKTLDILHLIFTQTSYDVFFIDWERPRNSGPEANLTNTMMPTLKATSVTERRGTLSDTNKRPDPKEEKERMIRSEEMSEFNRVSCWRLLFVANEWNEIQIYRKVNPTIHLILLLFFLKVVNLEQITTADCNTSLTYDSDVYRAPYSSVLRVAMATSMWLGIGLLEYLFYLFIYSRFIEDRITEFVDFCSITNISMFIMTHTQFGYYIHGKSPHGNADTSMSMMIQALAKEKNNQVAKRGLGHAGDNQTFSISISAKLSTEYYRALTPILEKKNKGLDPTDSLASLEFEKRILYYSRLNRFLANFIENILRDMKYVIVRRNLMENLLDMEFKEPRDTGYFYADNENSFQEALFCGRERKLFFYDLVVFLFVDYFAQNYILAAFITYIVIKFYNILRSDLGKRNISRKTLVDKRFLI